MVLAHYLQVKNQAETNQPDMHMWWKKLGTLHPNKLSTEQILYLDLNNPTNINVEGNVIIDETLGKVLIGAGSKICSGALIKGPVVIGANCVIGNHVLIRGNSYIGNNVKLGFATEIKNAIINEHCTIGPQCFVADSILEPHVYFGAQVRTSNHRLDKKNISVLVNEKFIDTGLEKLGCYIGEHSSLGIQVIILPGRVIQKNTLIGPRITVKNNLNSGKYMLNQQIMYTEE